MSIGQVQVGDEEVDRMPVDRGHGFGEGAARRRQPAMRPACNDAGEPLADRAVVLDQQDAAGG
jgi:hypothetical protein